MEFRYSFNSRDMQSGCSNFEHTTLPHKSQEAFVTLPRALPFPPEGFLASPEAYCPHTLTNPPHGAPTLLSQDFANDLNSFDLGVLLHFLFWHSNSKHPIFHTSLDLANLRILGQSEPSKELSSAPLNAMPLVRLLLLLFASLSAYLKNSSFFHLHLHFFFLDTRKISFEDMGFWGFLPIDLMVSLEKVGSDGVKASKLNVIPSKGSHMSREKGSKMLVRRPKKLGMIDI
ncbi:Alpha crystallin/Hsp20 domain-containing protein [Cinnamomum micranthum f. kanehirae]|uniref:Alpha crystallin/Hsp20 domain-containing protein n=1 Tax=Cinnamomum micranthum f. kanehirae TaxID=337451 RepID=A0A443NSS8_9MAGN|nr:Alpha crystallin/Hsp20 domain-containing protein [Cinnamomum micranthum f. kanehirae]